MNTRAWIRKGLVPLLALGAVYQASPYRVGVVVGDSMSPSVKNGSVYVLDREHYRAHLPRKGDVVVFRKGGLNYIKRVIAVGGDTVYVTTIPSTGREELVMDWEVEKLRRINRFVRYSAVKLVARRVPKDCCYVVGDHLAVSVDSRELGPIGNDAIIGRMVETPAPTAQVGHLAVVYASGSPIERS